VKHSSILEQLVRFSAGLSPSNIICIGLVVGLQVTITRRHYGRQYVFRLQGLDIREVSANSNDIPVDSFYQSPFSTGFWLLHSFPSSFVKPSCMLSSLSALSLEFKLTTWTSGIGCLLGPSCMLQPPGSLLTGKIYSPILSVVFTSMKSEMFSKVCSTSRERVSSL
jgi:hypothetical protein